MGEEPDSETDTISTRHKSVSEIYIHRTRSERAATRVRILVQDQTREERGDIPCDLWSIFQTMTNGFPAKPSNSDESENYNQELEETLDNVRNCFKVFVCRYSKYTIRGALPVIQRIFMELVELLENCLLDLRQMEHNKTCNNPSQDFRREEIFGKVDVYNNMVLLMTQATTYRHSVICDTWLHRINTALRTDIREVSTYDDLISVYRRAK